MEYSETDIEAFWRKMCDVHKSRAERAGRHADGAWAFAVELLGKIGNTDETPAGLQQLKDEARDTAARMTAYLDDGK